MSIGTFDEEARQRLSALADGELDADAGATAFHAWSGDGAARRDWHAWHLIGDVLRSEDLASDPSRDLRFCAALRVRLASEAVVLAPTPGRAARAVPDGGARANRWMFGSAAAAGLVLVAGTFTLLRTDAPAPARVASADGPTLRAAAPAPQAAPMAVTIQRESAAPAVAVMADNRMIRDAQLDRYLVAHKQFAGSSALGVPSVFLRSATVDSAAR
jgi:sigma-E factor negative regulatory protein RseA